MIPMMKPPVARLVYGNARLAAFCLCAMLICRPAAAMPMKPPAAPVHHFPGAGVRNPHLKGVGSTVEHPKAPIRKRPVDHLVHRPWHHRWDYRTWITLHRGLGVIRGFVRGPGGGALSSAKVWLKHPGGAAFGLISRKHITYTDAAGNFTMFGVRPGGYRVVAMEGKKRGHSHAAVHPGITAEVAVKI